MLKKLKMYPIKPQETLKFENCYNNCETQALIISKSRDISILVSAAKFVSHS